MKHIDFTPDLGGWGIEALDSLSESITAGIRKAVEETLHEAFQNDESYVYFPAEWADHDGIGGPPVSDPLTVYLRVGLESSGEKPTYAFSLRDQLESTLEACAIDGSFAEGLGRLSVALRELAAEIDSARAKGVANAAKRWPRGPGA